jgi:hypothetical protein
VKHSIKTTPQDDLSLGEDIFYLFPEGESYTQQYAIEMLDFLLRKHKIMDEGENPLPVTLDIFPRFGIIGHKSMFIDKKGKGTPILTIVKTTIVLNSPDWFKNLKKT